MLWYTSVAVCLWKCSCYIVDCRQVGLPKFSPLIFWMFPSPPRPPCQQCILPKFHTFIALLNFRKKLAWSGEGRMKDSRKQAVESIELDTKFVLCVIVRSVLKSNLLVFLLFFAFFIFPFPPFRSLFLLFFPLLPFIPSLSYFVLSTVTAPLSACFFRFFRFFFLFFVGIFKYTNLERWNTLPQKSIGFFHKR